MEMIYRNHSKFLEEGRIQFKAMDGRKGYAEGGPYDVIFCGGGS